MSILDPTIWHRYGRGRIFSFGVTRGELFHAIKTAVEPHEEKYGFVFGVADVTGPKRRFQGLNEFAEVEFDCFLQELELGASALWLRSFDLTPDLGDRTRSADGIFSSNGLIRVTDGQSMSMIACESSIGLVNKAYNIETNQRKEHTQYESIFLKIRKNLNALKKMKVVSTETPSKRFFYCSEGFEKVFHTCEKCKGKKLLVI